MFGVELFAKCLFAFRQLTFEIFQHRQNICQERRDRSIDGKERERTFLLTGFEDVVVVLHGDHQGAKVSIDFEENLIRRRIEGNELMEIIQLDPKVLDELPLLKNPFDVLQRRLPFGDFVQKGTGRLIGL